MSQVENRGVIFHAWQLQLKQPQAAGQSSSCSEFVAATAFTGHCPLRRRLSMVRHSSAIFSRSRIWSCNSSTSNTSQGKEGRSLVSTRHGQQGSLHNHALPSGPGGSH